MYQRVLRRVSDDNTVALRVILVSGQKEEREEEGVIQGELEIEENPIIINIIINKWKRLLDKVLMSSFLKFMYKSV